MRISFILLLSSWLIVCCNTEKQLPSRLEGDVVYEIFLRSYADSDGDSIGDINGLISRLDYLQDLGIRAIWLMPVMPSPSYHKYDVTDYTSIDPEYGTPDDFKRLIQEAHRRNIKVIIDMVVNHTSSQHPWFIEASKGPENPYRHYYVWAHRDSVRDQIRRKTITLDSDNITQWHPVNGDTIREQYYGFFWGGMPDLNMDNPLVLQEFSDIGRFWLDTMNVDGFRLDAAKHIFPGEQAAKNHAFWKWFRRTMQDIKPDVYLVGEVWASAEEAAPYLPGIPALFNFDLAYALADAVRAGQDSSGLIRRYRQIRGYYEKASPEFSDAVFLRNHDQNRILTELNDDPQAARLAAVILLTLPGTPYIYYGEEIGMKGRKPDEFIREPFLWDVPARDSMRTRWETAVYSTDESVVPLESQLRDSASYHHLYRKWIRLRNTDNVLRLGRLEEVASPDKRILMYKRVWNNETRLVIHNLSAELLTIPLIDFGAAENELAANGGANLKDRRITLPARSSLVLK